MTREQLNHILSPQMNDSSSAISPNLNQRAIEAALDARWEEALKLNRKIIKQDPQNVDALNRQARVCMELGKGNLAKKFYNQVLKCDPYNPIALKNLKIIKSFKAKDSNFKPNGHAKLSASLFLQEPGKTKVVSLLNVAEPQKLSQTFCGMKVAIMIKNRKIIIIDSNETYMGVLPDDISHGLIRLIKGGNKYDLFIKSIRVNSLSVLIRETFRSKRFKNQPSFLDSSNRLQSTDIITALDGEDGDSDQVEEEQEEV